MKRLVKVVGCLVAAAMAVAVLAAVVVGWQGYRMYRDALEAASIERVIEELKGRAGYVTVDELPQVYLDAVVAVEDHRFYEHPGIDVIAIGRAALNDMRTLSLREGGSTITQQLAKNLFFTQKKHFSRKVAEVLMAFDLEKMYSKAELLELYVNSAYFGEGLTGIGNAAPGLLGKPASLMSDYECTLMAGLPNAPSVLSDDDEAAAARQRIVVSQMEKYGFDAGQASTVR